MSGCINTENINLCDKPGYCASQHDINSENISTENTAKVGHNCKLSILTLNVCGIVSKLEDPIFMSDWENYDILCFSETKLDDTYNELVQEKLSEIGFNVYVKNRTKISCTRSGGLIIAV